MAELPHADRRCLPRLADLVEVARAGSTIEPMLAAVRAEATLGELCGVLRELWGGYTEPPHL